MRQRKPLNLQGFFVVCSSCGQPAALPGHQTLEAIPAATSASESGMSAGQKNGAKPEGSRRKTSAAVACGYLRAAWALRIST
jgi:hypothetical protein